MLHRGAADFVAYIADRLGITPRGESTEVTIGGRSGVQIDVDAGDPGCESDPPDRLWLWEVQGVTDFHLNVGEAARIIAVDGDADVTVFVIETDYPAAGKFPRGMGPVRQALHTPNWSIRAG